MLFGSIRLDALSFVVFTGVLAVAAIVATIVPARRALRVDPMVALRNQSPSPWTPISASSNTSCCSPCCGSARAYAVPVREQIESRTGRTVARGALYTTLDRLEAKGLLRSRLGDPLPERGGRPRRYFTRDATRSREPARGAGIDREPVRGRGAETNDVTT